MYNALKLFMDTNPELCEECTQQYQRELAAESQKKEDKKRQWEKVEAMAHANPLYSEFMAAKEANTPAQKEISPSS